MSNDNGKHEDEIVALDPRTLAPNPFQVRVLDDKDPRVTERVESIKKHGLIELPIVRRTATGYQIGAGHIRVRACIILGLKEIKCIVRQLSDEEMAAVVLEENLKHETLNPIEEGKGYRNMKDHFHWSEEKVADKFGTTRDRVAQRIRLTTFPESLQRLIVEGRLSVSQAEAVNTAPVSKQMDLARRVVAVGLTVLQTTDEAKQLVEIEKANKSAIENIGGTVSSFNARLRNLESRMSSGEGMLLWVECEEMHVWKSRLCKYNLDGWCDAGNWVDEPTYWERRLAGVANFTKLKDGKWYIQACDSICSRCTVFERRPSTPNPETPKPP